MCVSGTLHPMSGGLSSLCPGEVLIEKEWVAANDSDGSVFVAQTLFTQH